ncbi:E3 ubiquitin-protein ligase synoviolin, partial [Exaiptasia diaphana]|uniref:RING-type E3 ubiquitin transferase n=1 Tax=Exaiptasia diaphana TaxID=2652724 RepID=A0A913XS55_EXADI
MKYTLHVIDLQSENPWDNKAVYLLYTELIMGFIKAILYVCFVVIMVKVHTFPLFAIRPMYLTLRGFKKSLSDVIMSRRAIANMNTLYPDATPEELSQGDNVCIICREEMTTGCKKIPCNHIFHASCLRSWFQRQQTCPTCRMDVLRPMPRPSPPPTQQPAQPQQPNAPQMMPPFGMFPGWPPVPPPPFQQPGTETTPTTTASTGATAGEAGLMNQAPPFSMPPPFMMPPPPPFMMPPPMLGMPFLPSNPTNTTDLSGLSVEELKNMETQERKNLESRIAMLRNIHALLD